MEKLKLLSALLCMSSFLSLHAGNENVEMTYDHTKDIKKGHPSVIPTVTTDGDEVTITCDSTIYNVDIVISDQYGNVMHQSANTIGPTETVIHSQSNGDSEKTVIDLYYDDKHLKGYFE